MMRRNVVMVLDTETADKSHAVYDVGYCIATAKGEILQERTFLVDEIFTDGQRMMGAFFASKLFSHYAGMLQHGEIALTPWDVIVEHMRYDHYAHNVNIVAAYNLAFDRRAMLKTHKLLGHNCPILRPSKMLDLWQFACEAKLNTATYKQLAIEQGWTTDAGNIRTGAEYAYRFCSGDWGFIEDHTALSDARIEVEIMASCYAAKKKIPYGILGSAPWKIVNS